MLKKTWPHWLLACFGLIPAVREAMSRFNGECGCWGLCPDTIPNLAWFVLLLVVLACCALYGGIRAYREIRRLSVLLAFAMPIVVMVAGAYAMLSIDFPRTKRTDGTCTAMVRGALVAQRNGSIPL